MSKCNPSLSSKLKVERGWTREQNLAIRSQWGVGSRLEVCSDAKATWTVHQVKTIKRGEGNTEILVCGGSIEVSRWADENCRPTPPLAKSRLTLLPMMSHKPGLYRAVSTSECLRIKSEILSLLRIAFLHNCLISRLFELRKIPSLKMPTTSAPYWLGLNVTMCLLPVSSTYVSPTTRSDNNSHLHQKSESCAREACGWLVDALSCGYRHDGSKRDDTIGPLIIAAMASVARDYIRGNGYNERKSGSAAAQSKSPRKSPAKPRKKSKISGAAPSSTLMSEAELKRLTTQKQAFGPVRKMIYKLTSEYKDVSTHVAIQRLLLTVLRVGEIVK